MKGRKVIFGVIVGVVFVLCGTHLFLLKYFYYNRYNVYARKVVLNDLKSRYNQEFELMSTKFETERVRFPDSSGYVQRWIFVLRDEEGRMFHAYLAKYAPHKIGYGDYAIENYYGKSGDTYGQIRIEEYLGDKYNLSSYREDKAVGFPDKKKDYLFVCREDNKEQIADILTSIYFSETEISDQGCLECVVTDEDEKELFCYWRKSVTKEMQDNNKEITEDTIYDYFLRQIKGVDWE